MIRWLCCAVLALGLSGGPAVAASSSDQTLRVIVQADLRILDPIWTTATITRNFGYMVYDTLFALDSGLKPRPQMVDRWTVSEDRLTYTFTLREGLRFHDGQPVTSSDCVASLERWSRRDVLGQTLAAALAEYRRVDDRTFSIVLNRPFPLLLEALAKPESNVPFMMPERLARTDADLQIKEAIGSGPFKFVAAAWEPGHKVVFVKNGDYVPRKEPPNWAAGGKIARVDRVEWLYIPDPATAMAAFTAGEADWWENPQPDFYPMLAADSRVSLVQGSPFSFAAILRFNETLPPFDNAKMRRALLYAADQAAYMTALAGDRKYWRPCFSYFSCDGPMASETGSEPLKEPRDLSQAKRLIAEAGYEGERVVLLDPTDFAIMHTLALVTEDLLRRLGVNVEAQAMDWGTLLARRASKAPLGQGGWNLFATTFPGITILDPAVNVLLRGNGARAWFGWPDDPVIEKLRDNWIDAADPEARLSIAAEIQRRAFATVPYLPLGEYSSRTAFHNNLEGVDIGPALFLWNVAKK